MFSIAAVHVFSHLIFSMAALPGTSLYISISSGSINCLFIMKPTPADAQGLSGLAEFRIFRFFSKILLRFSVMLWSR